MSSGTDYLIIIRSRFGKEISRVDFDADFTVFGYNEEIGSPFVFTLPFPGFAKKDGTIELVKNGRVLESRTISRNRPSISINDIREVDSVTFAVDISAFDKDEDELDYMVTYTPDDEMFFDIG